MTFISKHSKYANNPVFCASLIYGVHENNNGTLKTNSLNNDIYLSWELYKTVITIMDTNIQVQLLYSFSEVNINSLYIPKLQRNWLLIYVLIE